MSDAFGSIPDMELIELPPSVTLKSRIHYDAFGLKPWIVLTEQEKACWRKLKEAASFKPKRKKTQRRARKRRLPSSRCAPPPGFKPMQILQRPRMSASSPEFVPRVARAEPVHAHYFSGNQSFLVPRSHYMLNQPVPTGYYYPKPWPSNSMSDRTPFWYPY